LEKFTAQQFNNPTKIAPNNRSPVPISAQNPIEKCPREGVRRQRERALKETNILICVASKKPNQTKKSTSNEGKQDSFGVR